MKKIVKYGVGIATLSLLGGCNNGNSSTQATTTQTVASSKSATASNTEPQKGYLPVRIINSTGLINQPVYVFAKAGLKQNPADENSPVVDCILSFDKDGYGTCNKVDANTNIQQYAAESLGALHRDPTNTNDVLVYVPHVLSGRMYFSVGYPLNLSATKDADGYLRIADPDGFKPRDPNYYTLYDKVEFSFVNDTLDKNNHVQTGGIWFNPTAVDFFSLPIRIDAPSSVTFNHVGLSGSRVEVLDKINEEMKANTNTTAYQEWSKLILRYANSSGSSTILRVMAPGKAMVDNIQGTNPFNKDYLNHYINALWAYYKKEGNTVTINCQELASKMKLNNYVFTGHVDADDKFVFVNTDGSYPVKIDKPTDSVPFFAGAVGPFDAANNTPKAIIIRELTSAFDAGLLPAPSNEVLNKTYFENNRATFYTNNPLLHLTSDGPWYDLYSKALHSFGHTQPIYTFAYDDALGQDGTIHEPNGTNPGEISVTLENMSGTSIPNPYVDSNSYTVEAQIGETEAGVRSQVIYNGKSLTQNEIIPNVTIPMVIKLNGVEEKLYFNPQMVLPQADGVVINHTAGSNKIVVQFPGPGAGN